MDAMKMPSDAEMMRVAIDDLTNASATLPQILHALEELLLLVEPIDNANGMPLSLPLGVAPPAPWSGPGGVRYWFLQRA